MDYLAKIFKQVWAQGYECISGFHLSLYEQMASMIGEFNDCRNLLTQIADFATTGTCEPSMDSLTETETVKKVAQKKAIVDELKLISWKYEV
jgi:hypothetical protein